MLGISGEWLPPFTHQPPHPTSLFRSPYKCRTKRQDEARAFFLPATHLTSASPVPGLCASAGAPLALVVCYVNPPPPATTPLAIHQTQIHTAPTESGE